MKLKESDKGLKNQETVGADFLSGLGYTEKICQLVRRQREAERYFAFEENNTATLTDQMTPEEARTWRQDPLHHTLIVLCDCHVRAHSLRGSNVPCIESYAAMLARHSTVNPKRNPLGYLYGSKFFALAPYFPPEIVLGDLAQLTEEDLMQCAKPEHRALMLIFVRTHLCQYLRPANSVRKE